MVRITLVSLVIALLWSAAAHLAAAQGQSVRRGGVAASQQVTCDIGPPATVPVEAAAAGFTHCVANFDFSQPEYATLSNWFDCEGSKPRVLWHRGSAGVTFVNPCNIHQKIDPAINQNVMNFQWLISYNNNGFNRTRIPQSNQVGGQTFNNWTNSPTLTVGNYYVQTVNRIEATCPASACPQNSGGPDDVYMWGYYNSPDGGGLEVDIQEFQTNQLNAQSGVAAGNCSQCIAAGVVPTWSNWGANRKNLPGNYSNTVFHNYGALLTSDGKTDKRVCMYIDDVLQNDTGCQIAYSSAGVADTTHFDNRSWILISAGSNNGAAGQPINFNVANVVVWSCAAYQQAGAAGMCNGATLHSSTLNTGQTLAYYH